MEELKTLGIIPPKFVLDHYWEVFSAIFWKLSMSKLEKRNMLTIEEILDYRSSV